MGKITDSLLSGTRGRTGRIVVSNIEGHEISRMRPRKSNRISTPKQQVIKKIQFCCTIYTRLQNIG